MTTLSRILAIIASAGLCLATAAAAAAGAGAGEPADENPAPAIVTTTPRALQNDVDPALDRIEVTFDQPMRDKSWSWTGGGETYPETRGKPSYDDKRVTCTMPVKLRPAKVYWIGINSPSHRNFVSEQGTPADRYVILFATRSIDGKPTVIPLDLQQRAKAINKRHNIAKPSTKPKD
jgi:hypothetical protein